MKGLYNLTGHMDRNSKNGTHKFYIALTGKLLMQYKINIDGRIDRDTGRNIMEYDKGI